MKLSLRSKGPQMGGRVVQPDMGSRLVRLLRLERCLWFKSCGCALRSQLRTRKGINRLVRRGLHDEERTSSGNMQFTGTVPRSELT